MNDAKENPTEFVAYLSYVRGLWGVSNKVSRQIVRFLEKEYIFKRLVKGNTQYQGQFCRRVELPCFNRAYGVS